MTTNATTPEVLGSNPVLEAIGKLNPPTQSELARLTGRFPQEVWRWVQQGRVPSTVARLIARRTGVPAARLCPRVFGKQVASQKVTHGRRSP